MEIEKCMERRLALNDKLISWREIEGEVVVLQKKERSFYELNATASFIWKQAADKIKIEKIIEALQKKIKHVDQETLKKDVFEFIVYLLENKYFLLEGAN